MHSVTERSPSNAEREKRIKRNRCRQCGREKFHYEVTCDRCWSKTEKGAEWHRKRKRH